MNLIHRNVHLRLAVLLCASLLIMVSAGPPKSEAILMGRRTYEFFKKAICYQCP